MPGPFYLTSTTASNATSGQLQDGGTAPASATLASGWTVGTTVAAQYSDLNFGVKKTAATFSATVGPASSPTGGVNNWYRTPNWLSGSFAAGNWTIAVGLIGITAAATGIGNLRVRVWASRYPDADNTFHGGVVVPPREITTSTVALSSWSNISTTVEQDTTATWSAPAMTLNAEYLYFEFSMEVTTASGSSTAAVVLRAGSNSAITPTAFTPALMHEVQEVDQSPTATSVAVTFALAQGAGNANVVVALIDDTTTVPTKISDTSGNTYWPVVVAASGESATLRTWVWVATRIKAATAGTNVVTVNVSASALIECIAREYTADSPLMVDYTAISTGTSVSTTTTATGNAIKPARLRSIVISWATMSDGTGKFANPPWTMGRATAANTFTADQVLDPMPSGTSITPTATQVTAAQWQIITIVLTPELAAGSQTYGQLLPLGPAGRAKGRWFPTLEAYAPAATSSAVTGGAAQRLGGLTQAAAGAETLAGTATQRLGGLRQAATGAETIPGIAAQRLGGLRQAASGAETMSGAVAQRLGGLRQALSAALTIAGTVAQRLGSLRQSASGAEAFSGTAAQRLGALRQSATGTETISGTSGQRLGRLRQAMSGSETNTGPAAQRVAGLRQAATGAEKIAGSSAQRLGSLRQALSAAQAITGTIPQRLGALRQSATGALAILGTAPQRIGALRQSATGAEAISGAAPQRLGGLRQSATGALAGSGAASQRLGAARQSASGTEAMTGAGTQHLGSPRQAASGAETVSGSALQRAGALRQSALGAEAIGGISGQPLGAMRQAASGAESMSGVVLQRLDDLIQALIGASLSGIGGPIAQQLRGLVQATTGEISQAIVGTASQRLGAMRSGGAAFPTGPVVPLVVDTSPVVLVFATALATALVVDTAPVAIVFQDPIEG
jgi:hypothetical protein